MSTLTLWLLISCGIAFLTKGIGYLLPTDKLEQPTFLRIAATMTIGLLAALVTMNTFADGQSLALDARVVALVAAIIALLLRAPFLAVVVIGAAAAAVARLAGLG